MSLIALLTDFGNFDYYVGVMKGVISSINPEAKIIDINHNINQGNILKAAYQLNCSYPYFPKHTIFLCVVDPGVGTNRKAILVKTADHYFIAPDNGLLTGILDKYQECQVIHLNNNNYFLKKTSNTFHGRDIFSPIAAYLSNGISIQEFGPEIAISELIRLNIFQPKIVENRIIANILDIDHFGNIITNVKANSLQNYKFKSLVINNQQVNQQVKSYGDVSPGTPVVLTGSSGYLEVSVSQGNAAQELQINGNERVIVNIVKKL